MNTSHPNQDSLQTRLRELASQTDTDDPYVATLLHRAYTQSQLTPLVAKMVKTKIENQQAEHRPRKEKSTGTKVIEGIYRLVKRDKVANTDQEKPITYLPNKEEEQNEEIE